jgi:4-amino-4-deoxy-L-arabinose transferase-like glycosyltransferase
MIQRPKVVPLWYVILLAVLLRAAVMVREVGALADPDNYLPLARSLVAGTGFALGVHPTAVRPPLYPLLLAPVVAIWGNRPDFGVALLHLALGAGTVWLTAAAAERSGLSRPRAIFAAFVTACDPVLVWQARAVMTETPSAFLIAASLAGLCCRGWLAPVLGGLGFGLAALCRPSLLPSAVLTISAALLAKPGELRQRLMRAGVLAATLALVLLPWATRNSRVFGEPIWMTTHGGYTLALANNPVYYREVLNGPPDRVWLSSPEQWLWWDSVNQATAGMSETEADRYLRATVWKLARERPVDFGRAMLARFGHFWSVAPAASVYDRSARWLTIAWTLPLWLALGLGLFERELWRWPRIAAPLTILGLALLHLFFWTDMRMRAPIVPAIALVAAGAAWPWLAPRRVAAVQANTARAQGNRDG